MVGGTRARIRTSSRRTTGGGGTTPTVHDGPTFGPGNANDHGVTAIAQGVLAMPALALATQVHAQEAVSMPSLALRADAQTEQCYLLSPALLATTQTLAETGAVSLSTLQAGLGLAGLGAVSMASLTATMQAAETATLTTSQVATAFQAQAEREALSLATLAMSTSLAELGALSMPALAATALIGETAKLTATASGAPLWTSVLTNTNNAASIVVNVPAGTQPGDLLLVFVAATDTGPTIGLVWQATAGFNIAVQRLNNGVTDTTAAACYYRIADGTEAASYTFTGSGTVVARRTTGEMHRIQAVAQVNPINVSASDILASTALTTNPVSPAVSTTVTNCLVFAFLAHDHGAVSNSHTAPTSNTERTDFEANNGTSRVGATADSRVFAASGSTGTATHTCSETVATDAVMLRVGVAPGTVTLL